MGNRKLLAIKKVLEEWCHWLEGARVPFLVWIDHKNLVNIDTLPIFVMLGGASPTKLTYLPCSILVKIFHSLTGLVQGMLSQMLCPASFPPLPNLKSEPILPEHRFVANTYLEIESLVRLPLFPVNATLIALSFPSLSNHKSSSGGSQLSCHVTQVNVEPPNSFSTVSGGLQWPTTFVPLLCFPDLDYSKCVFDSGICLALLYFRQSRVDLLDTDPLE